jgi:hypothetical protein
MEISQTGEISRVSGFKSPLQRNPRALGLTSRNVVSRMSRDGGGLDKLATYGQRAIDSLFLTVGLMNRLVEFPLEQGGSVLIEIDETPAGPAMRGLGKDRPTVAERADKTFEEATAAVVPAAGSLIARLWAAADPPDEVGIEFGVQLSAQTGAFRPPHAASECIPQAL